MMTMILNTINYEIMDEKKEKNLLDYTSKEYVNWKEKVTEKNKNKLWLKKSRKIAIKVNRVLKNKNLSQKQFAELMNVSPQRISKILKGRENLTLETISNIENTLNIKLLHIIYKKDDYYPFTFEFVLDLKNIIPHSLEVNKEKEEVINFINERRLEIVDKKYLC